MAGDYVMRMGPSKVGLVPLQKRGLKEFLAFFAMLGHSKKIEPGSRVLVSYGMCRYFFFFPFRLSPSVLETLSSEMGTVGQCQAPGAHFCCGPQSQAVCPK